jgi:starch phosphorylase
MSQLQTFQVFPRTPDSLFFLEKLSRNLWWCWQQDAQELFRRIDPKGW